MTIEDFLKKFDRYLTYSCDGKKKGCIIHPNLPHNFLEVTEEFKDRLKDAFAKKFMMIQSGIEENDPITQFAFMILENSD